MLALAAVMTAVGVHAGNPSIQLQYDISDPPVIESPLEEAVAFWERFRDSFDRRTDELFAERLHPLNVLSWSVNADSESDPLHEHTADVARRALSRSVTHGFREATMELPIMLWLKDRRGWLADVLENSVGNVREESVAPVEMSYHVVERSWWKRLSEAGGVRYGIRPFRTSPYAFLSLAIGDGDQKVLLGNLRYHYRNFAEHKFELALSVPLPHGLSIDFGTSYRLGRDDDGALLVLKLFKEFRPGGILHVGLEARERPALFAGMSVPW